MSRVAVFDCFSGIAGDMTLAALLDAGASLTEIRRGLETLGIPPFEIAAERVTRGGMQALHLRLAISREETYQPDQMREMLRGADIPERARERALAAVAALELGEWHAHAGQEVHLHEAGGVDALIDITGSILALESLDIGQAWCPVVTVGAATITKSAHGVLPAAPGPAAAHILQEAGFAVRFVEASHELVTPTGAAILAAVATPGATVMKPNLHGCGAGTMDPPNRPNALRVFVGEPAAVEEPPRVPSSAALRELVLLEANIDDMTPALLAHVRDELMAAGARDAWIEPIAMKKGRAASKLCVLVTPSEEEAFAARVLSATTTLGVRVADYRRWEAARHVETVQTSLGPVRYKVGEWDGKRRALPEHEDVIAIAEREGLHALEVQRRLEREFGG